ncbi:hypothetical protein H2136_18465 [Aeromonas hydrophila]|uniref:Uncharacterized protein n=1 Tax=Aeromonas hydrophila TaxID=644 RepID=A0A926FLN3_AERHY|nr:hypothetical protein [Aeromonas hydrophila]
MNGCPDPSRFAPDRPGPSLRVVLAAGPLPGIGAGVGVWASEREIDEGSPS